MSPRLILSKPGQLCLGYIVAHVAAHFLARWFEVSPGIVTSIWYAPAGLALALLLLLGPRYWPVVFLANFGTAWLGSADRPLWSALIFPGLLTSIYALTAAAVRRHGAARLLPGDTRETCIFIATIFGAPLVAALAGMSAAVIVRWNTNPYTLEAFLRSVREWWIGDACGALTVVPAALVFLGPWLDDRPAPAGGRPLRPGLVLVQVAILFGTLALVLFLPALRPHRAFYLCFLPLVWICVSHGLRGATLTTLTVLLGGLVAMRLNGTTRDYSYVFLMFEVAVAGVGLGLGTMVARRDEAEAKLAARNAELARLNRLESDERIAAQLAEEKARLEVLRYQLNPHFLFNSLNSIYGLLFENARGAAEMVLRLSDFCRATLSSPAAGHPTLGTEIEILRNYLDVEKVRWGDQLAVEIDVAPEVGPVPIPPFLLLPLVENAIKYGSRTSPGVLKLVVRAHREADDVRIAIANTGTWLRPGMQLTPSTGIGLENLRQRLQRYYPEVHRFSTKSADGWVVAEVRIPLAGPVPSSPGPRRPPDT